MSSGPRILFRTYNRRGLGHLMRGLNIATELMHLAPTADILFYARRKPPAGFTAQDVRFFLDPDENHSSWPDVVRAFDPQIIVYDTMQPQTQREEASALNGKLVYIMRQCSRERQLAVFGHPIMNQVDLIIVPHEKAEFGHCVPNGLLRKTHFVGSIVRQPNPSKREALMAKYRLARSGFTLLSSPGGGGFVAEAKSFFDIVFRAHKLLLPRLSALKHIVIKGPNFPDPLEALAGMKIVDAEPDLVHLLPLADLVISAGGYNTVTEIRVAKAPAVFLPSPRTHDDQWDRVAAVRSAGLAHVCSHQTADEAAKEIADLCISPDELGKMRESYKEDSVPLGNESAARLILDLVAR